ncbi:hypothetical protein TWF730_004196 [Orbilia blumenaviensis]|uniref:Uncharacterized protein n=1 Tax=Orbilia blumenaviensis TaxID=1796055 RepID=A0AAV9U206_9PEZI
MIAIRDHANTVTTFESPDFALLRVYTMAFLYFLLMMAKFSYMAPILEESGATPKSGSTLGVSRLLDGFPLGPRVDDDPISEPQFQFRIVCRALVDIWTGQWAQIRVPGIPSRYYFTDAQLSTLPVPPMGSNWALAISRCRRCSCSPDGEIKVASSRRGASSAGLPVRRGAQCPRTQAVIRRCMFVHGLESETRVAGPLAGPVAGPANHRAEVPGDENVYQERPEETAPLIANDPEIAPYPLYGPEGIANDPEIAPYPLYEPEGIAIGWEDGEDPWIHRDESHSPIDYGAPPKWDWRNEFGKNFGFHGGGSGGSGGIFKRDHRLEEAATSDAGRNIDIGRSVDIEAYI